MALNPQEAGVRLETFLRRKGMQQKELAEVVGVEPSYISRMVKGHVNWTTGKHFGRIAAQLDLSDDEIKELNPAAVVERVSSEPKWGAHQSLMQGIDDAIPPALAEAGELYKAIDPRIADPDVQLALARAGFFGGGPQTPQDWIRYFNDVRDWIGRDTR